MSDTMKARRLIVLAVMMVLWVSAMAPAFAMSEITDDNKQFQHAPIKRGGYGNSLTWAGYAVTGSNGSVTDVKGSWIVPAVTCSSTTNQTSSSWVGIDGLNSPTVEQIGTTSECSGNIPKYYAWFQFFPNSVSIINSMTVHPGDVMSAEVKYIGGLSNNGWFTVSITDVTRRTPAFLRIFYVKGANRNSAEWIVEASSINGDIISLPDFGTAYFGLDQTGVRYTNFATVNGVTGPIGSFSSSSVLAITMINNSGAVKAQPSPLSNDGTSFSVKWVTANGTITGVVTTSSGSPIQGAIVTADGETNITDASGNYAISIAPATYTVTASATGYVQQSTTGVIVTSNNTTTVNFALSPVLQANGTIAGTVINASSGAAIAGAIVTADGTTTNTNSSGGYSISIEPGTYTLTASATGYISNSTTVTVGPGATVTQNFALQPTVASVCSGQVSVDKSQPKFSRDIGLTSAHIVAQRFIPSSKCLTKMKARIINSVAGRSLVIEIRKDSGGVPLGGPRDPNGLIGSVTVPSSSFPFYALPETPYNFADTEINLNMVVPLEPLHIVMFTDDYPKISIPSYHIVFYEFPNPTEYLQSKYGSGTWIKNGQLYYSTYKQTYE